MLTGIAQLLVVNNKLDAKVVQKIYDSTISTQTPFIKKLMESKVITSADLAKTLHQSLNLPLLDLSAVDEGSVVRDVLDEDFCREKRILPLAKRGKQLLIAVDDPTDRSLLDHIRFSKGVEPVYVLVKYDDLNKFLHIGSTAGSYVGGEISDIFAAADVAASSSTSEVEDESVANSPVVKFLKKVLLDAISMGASDLHFEPYEFNYRIRYRIDGELREIIQPPMSIKDTLSSRIKVISNLDISEKRVPQDGRTKLKVGDKSIDFRVSTLPTLFGEKVVIRILDGSSAQLGIDALGYEPVEKARLMSAIERPYGMVLVTGPTGSGKTVSLYTCLNILNKPGVNISTAEDPSEINLPGVNQVNMNDKAGLTFAAALKSFLRQDPDIIMVGEIRDLETADIAIKAAQTGHMVLSTLHTNDAPTTLTRMINMGIAPFNIASSVILITAQRLARRLCKFCKVPENIPVQALISAGFREEQIDGSWTPYKAVGCDHCNNGYKGRVGIYQVMPISEAIQQIILKQGNAVDIAIQSKLEGVNSLRDSGLTKVMQGVTSLAAVLAVTNEG